MKVALRETEESDRLILFEHQREPEGNEMAAFPPRDEQAFATHWERLKADDTAIRRRLASIHRPRIISLRRDPTRVACASQTIQPTIKCDECAATARSSGSVAASS